MKTSQEYEEEFRRKYTKHEQEEPEPEKVPLRGKKIKSRRIIRLLFSKCPMCHLKITEDVPEFVDLKTLGEKFIMLQFGSNPDNTGYESYWCGFCKKFYLMMISPRLIAMDYQMKT